MQSWHSLLPTNTWVSNTAVVRNIHECSQFGFSPAYSNSYFCGLSYCIAARCPQNTVPIMSFPLTSSILASSPPLVAVFKTLSLAIPPPVSSHDLLLLSFWFEFSLSPLQFYALWWGPFLFSPLGQIKKTRQRQHTQPVPHTHVHANTHTHRHERTSTSAAGLIALEVLCLFPSKLTSSKQGTKETEPINEIH